MNLPYDPAVPFLRYFPTEIKTRGFTELGLTWKQGRSDVPPLKVAAQHPPRLPGFGH